MTTLAKEFNDIITNGQLADGTMNTEKLLVSKYDSNSYVTAGNISVNADMISDLSKFHTMRHEVRILIWQTIYMHLRTR